MDNHRLTGTVQSGGTDGAQPLAGAFVTLYDATEILSVVGTGTTNGSGWFETDHDPDPTAEGIYYVTASLPGGVLLVNVVGPEIQGPIVINELTTVAAAYAMAQFIDGSAIAGNTFGLRIASGMNDNLVSPLTGESSAVMLNPPNADQTNSLRSTRALANLLAPTARQQSGAWGTLQQLTTPPGGPPPADTFQAMVNVARNPASNVTGIYDQSRTLEIYTPSLATAPDSAWTLAVKVNRTGDDEYRMFGGPANISWDQRGYAWIANNVFQGEAGSGDFVVVLKPDGTPSDGTDGTPKSPVFGNGLNGPGFGVSVAPDGKVWVGSFGWGRKDSFPKEGVASKFGRAGNPEGSFVQGTVRIQGTVADAQNNLWLASYGNVDTGGTVSGAVVVYPRAILDGQPDADPAAFLSYPADPTTQQGPGDGTFGIAVHPDAPGSAWVTYGNGLGWPQAYPGAVARYSIDGETLSCTFSLPDVGLALKGIALDSGLNAWVASGGDDTVYLVASDGGTVTGFTDRGGLLGPWGVAVDGNDDVWVANFGHMGVTEDYTNAGISKLAGVGSPSGLPVGAALTPGLGYTLPSAGDPVTLPNGANLYKDGTPCLSPLMRMTSVTIDQAGNVWAVNNWKPRFGTDFEPGAGNPGGDGIVIFVGLAKPPSWPWPQP
jgi:hypothetical protein